MLRSRFFHLMQAKRVSVPIPRFFHHEFTHPEPQPPQTETKKPTLAAAQAQKYKIFRDEDSTEIFDVVEERRRYQSQDEPDQLVDEYLGLNLKRGLHGVFDIEDLVDVLRKENAEDIFVCSVPKEMKYVDYIVVCSGRSFRHMLATAEFVRRMFKVKRDKGDILPKIEGEQSRDWMALDLGNIALHIFSPKSREAYDLESLWAIGAEYDREYNKPDQMADLFAQHSSLLNEFTPKTT